MTSSFENQQQVEFFTVPTDQSFDLAADDKTQKYYMGAQNYSSSGSHLRNNETEPTPQIPKEPAECSSEPEIETRFLLYLLLNITGIIKDDMNVR